MYILKMTNYPALVRLFEIKYPYHCSSLSISNFMKQKPQLSFWQIWNMSFGFLGIQFGFALQNTNVRRIFETLGAKVEDIPVLGIAAPVTGLIIQPIIGHLSDNTWNRLGRRRPFFLIGAILASLALLIMPNSPALWVAAGMLLHPGNVGAYFYQEVRNRISHASPADFCLALF